MYNALLFLHSFLRWVILALALVAIFRSYAGMTTGRPFDATDKKTGLFLLIAAHTTLLIGLYQWIAGPWGLQNISSIGMDAVMKDRVYRFYGVEHMTGMIIAIILITIGRRFGKKEIPDRTKHKGTFWYYLTALVIILISIPWPFLKGIGRPWLW